MRVQSRCAQGSKQAAPTYTYLDLSSLPARPHARNTEGGWIFRKSGNPGEGNLSKYNSACNDSPDEKLPYAQCVLFVAGLCLIAYISDVARGYNVIPNPE